MVESSSTCFVSTCPTFERNPNCSDKRPGMTQLLWAWVNGRQCQNSPRQTRKEHSVLLAPIRQKCHTHAWPAEWQPKTPLTSVHPFEAKYCLSPYDFCHAPVKWQACPPPRGFEEFFAHLEVDPLVQVPACQSGRIGRSFEELGAPGRTTRNKKLLGAPGIATRSKDATRGSRRSKT